MDGECIGRFVVCDCRSNLIRIRADDKVPIYVDFYKICDDSVCSGLPVYTCICVDDQNIGIPEIKGVSVYHAIISVINSKRMNPIAGQDTVLASVITDKQISAFLLYFFGTIKKEVIAVEFQDAVRRQVVFKILVAEIDWCFEVDPMITEVDQAYEFIIGKT